MDAKGHASAWQHAENALRREALTATSSEERAAFAAAHKLAGHVAKGYAKVYLDELTAVQHKEAELDEEARIAYLKSGHATASPDETAKRKLALNNSDAERNGLKEPEK